jgi:phage gp37-like protein
MRLPMLAELENDLIAHIKASALGAKLRDVAGLPDLTGESLIKRFATDAPAVYVAPAAFQIESRSAKVHFGIACVARNSRGQTAARLGEAIGPVGLYEMLESIAAMFDEAQINKTIWKATAIDFMNDELLYKAGLTAGVAQIETRVKQFTL